MKMSITCLSRVLESWAVQRQVLKKTSGGMVKKKCYFGIRFLWLIPFYPSAPLWFLHPTLRRPAAPAAAVGCSPWPERGRLRRKTARGRMWASVRSGAQVGGHGTHPWAAWDGRTGGRGLQGQRTVQVAKGAGESLRPVGALWWGCSPDSSLSLCEADPRCHMSL